MHVHVVFDVQYQSVVIVVKEGTEDQPMHDSYVSLFLTWREIVDIMFELVWA